MLSQEVDLSDLPDTDKQAIVMSKSDTGGMIATVVSAISCIALEKLVSHVAHGSQAEARLKLHLHQSATQRAIAPVNRGEKFIIPQLCLFIDGELELPDDEIFLYAADWKLIGPAQLTETEFSLQPDGMTFAIDILDGHVRQSIVAPAEQLNLDFVDTGWTVNQLSYWLDKRLRMPEVPQPQMLEFIRHTIAFLEDERKIPLTALSRGRFLLLKVLNSKIRQLRQQAKQRGYQILLYGPSPKVEVSYDYSFSFEPNAYIPPRQYHGKYDFKKHFYPNIFEMNGEEMECAWAIEMLGDRLRFWVRNIERDSRSFRLQTSTDYFYPDFVALLEDGRILVVEYKGDLYNPQDVGEKDNLGQLWARESQGKGVFLMAWKQDDQGRNVHQQLLAAIS
jgi:type III restriction enzyme